MFCSENSHQNSKSEENFSIRSGNKIENVLPEYSVRYQDPNSPTGRFSPVIPSGIIYPIPVGNNSKIPSSDFFPIPPRYFSKIPEDAISDTSYKSTSSTPTDYKIHLLYPDSATTVKPYSGSTSNLIPNIKLKNSKIYQQILSQLFNDKQEPKDIKRCDGNDKNWRKAKENWAATISAAQCAKVQLLSYRQF